MMRFITSILKSQGFILIAALFAVTAELGCGNSSAKNSAQGDGAPPPPQLPVLQIEKASATTYQTFPASLQGKINVEVRAQVDGYLKKMYVDEGAYVKAGQPLFKIDDAPYAEALNNARASLQSAEANAERTKVEADRLVPLVQNNVISDVQLKTAQANYAAAQASVAQMRAMVNTAAINVGYTLIKAPVSGYIGKLPFKTGALVTKSQMEPLTMLSDISEMYAYFSLSEPDFIAFKNKYAGNTLEEKLKSVPPVELVLADDSVYEQKGKIELVEGQFDETTGAINFRATFPNASRLLRSGNTGKIRMPQMFDSVLVVPQDATFEIQDKTFVYTVGDSNKIITKPITISGRTTSYYYVSNGVKAGDKIVLSSQSTMMMGGLRDGMPITLQMVSADSLMKAKPLQ